MSIESINLWHQRARPSPTERDFQTQLGCHFEEFAEMLAALRGGSPSVDDSLEALHATVDSMAFGLKAGSIAISVPPGGRGAFLDSLADQIVTAVGVGHCAGMRMAEGVRRVNTSNWSKTVDGEFLRDANGKIIKGPGYAEPDLSGLF